MNDIVKKDVSKPDNPAPDGSANPVNSAVLSVATTKTVDDELAALAKALAHPVRVRILRILAHRTSCVCGDIVDELPLAQSTVSEHLRILKSAGLIIGEVDGPRVCYCIDAVALARFKALVGDLPSPENVPKPADCRASV